VWDEAFYPLATGRWTRGDPGVVVGGSLTKLFACPGLRLGYLLAPDDELAARVRDRQPEWAVNSLAVAVLPDLVELADLTRWSGCVAAWRADLTAVLRAAGLTPDPSDANYVLVRDAPGLRSHLARHRVLVRDTATFGITWRCAHRCTRPNWSRRAPSSPREVDSMLDSVIAALTRDLDVVLFDVGGTLIDEAPPGTPVSEPARPRPPRRR